MRLSGVRGAHCRPRVELFSRSWAALRAAVAGLPDDAFARPSGCAGWLVRDLVCHLVIDAQDVLITLASPAESEPTRDAVTYWDLGPLVWIRPGSRALVPHLAALSSVAMAPPCRPPPPCEARHQTPLPDPA